VLASIPARYSSSVAAIPVGAAPWTFTPAAFHAAAAVRIVNVLPVPARPTATLTPLPSPVRSRTICA
jgi:hypothetical protein